MTLVDLMLAVAALAAAVVLPCTQLIRDATKLSGWWVLLLSMAVGVAFGALLAGGGIVELQALTTYPAWGSGAVLGLLAGMTASGGKAVVTSIQTSGAWARAEVQAKAQGKSDAATAEGEAAEEAPALADGWELASIDELGRTRTDWPAVPGVEPDDAPLVTQ